MRVFGSRVGSFLGKGSGMDTDGKRLKALAHAKARLTGSLEVRQSRSITEQRSEHFSALTRWLQAPGLSKQSTATSPIDAQPATQTIRQHCICAKRSRDWPQAAIPSGSASGPPRTSGLGPKDISAFLAERAGSCLADQAPFRAMLRVLSHSSRPQRPESENHLFVECDHGENL